MSCASCSESTISAGPLFYLLGSNPNTAAHFGNWLIVVSKFPELKVQGYLLPEV